MQVIKIQNNNLNTSFGSGNVILHGFETKDFLHYDAIKKIAEEDKLDFSITRKKDSKFLPREDAYFIIARQKINVPPFIANGIGSIIISKKSNTEEIAENLYNEIIKTVENLADNVTKHTGTRPEFLKHLKK